MHVAGLLGWVLASYLLGSFPASIVLGKLFYHRDIRTEGSRNAGATNAFRVFGWRLGVAVLMLDSGKGVLAALLAAHYGGATGLSPGDSALLAGAGAVAGHIWTIFARFKGGKGVATAAGVLFAVSPIAAAATLLVFVLVVGRTGWVSAASLGAALAFPVSLLGLAAFGHPPSAVLAVFTLIVVPLIFITHRANIRRILRGEEPRIEALRFLAHST
ncbi:MAG TPA: glycerol-3-phosphate 1-O-acyltransferase PlsY [Rectinemataceae bacterium]|nr:glycerol-3-phosphate 1-O-acyltransferase PlsY [Rectinemataceae bacterium]